MSALAEKVKGAKEKLGGLLSVGVLEWAAEKTGVEILHCSP